MLRLENLLQPFKSVLQKAKVFLRCKRWKETLVFFSFILLALGFWLLQSLQQEYEIEINIPVRYKNVSPEIAFTDTVPSNVTVHVKDKGSVLLNYSFGRRFAPIDADMKNVNKKNGTFHISRKVIESDILKQLISTTSLISFEPQQIDISYSKSVQKKIPVAFNGEIHINAGFQQSGEIIISPSVVNAYASDVILDSLTAIQTVYTEIKDGDKTVTRNIPLQKIPGVNYDPSTVTVTIPIEEYTDKTLDIPVSCKGIPSHYTLRMFPAVIKVTCSVPLSRFKELSADQFSIEIPFANLEQNMSGTLPIELSVKPDWIRNATLFPDKIEFILEQNSHD